MSEGTADRPSSHLALDESGIAALDLLDHKEVDWSRVQRTAYLIHQHLRYTYPGPIRDLTQRLIIMPPEHYGDQRRILQRLDVSPSPRATASHEDAFGNVVLTLQVPRVEQAIDFEAWIVVERAVERGPHRVHASWLSDPRLREPSRLTAPDAALRRAAAALTAADGDSVALATRIAGWTHRSIRYAHGSTDIHTTAAAALAGGGGVCQDYAHIMLALCRLCGLAARYVSGHLLGEGGTHAWVEVLLPSAAGADLADVWAFDPTHDRRTGLSYLTVAVGRDYYDVAPTSGTFTAAYRGELSAYKRVGIIDYEPATA